MKNNERKEKSEGKRVRKRKELGVVQKMVGGH